MDIMDLKFGEEFDLVVDKGTMEWVGRGCWRADVQRASYDQG